MERLEKYGVMWALILQVVAIVWWSATISMKVDIQSDQVQTHAQLIHEEERKIILIEAKLEAIERQLDKQSKQLEDISASIKN